MSIKPYSCCRRQLDRKALMWKHEENTLLKEPGTSTPHEPQYIVTKLAGGGTSLHSVPPSSDYDTCHKSFIPMHPMRMCGDHIYESTRLRDPNNTSEIVPVNSSGDYGMRCDNGTLSGYSSRRQSGGNILDCDSGVDTNPASSDPQDLQFVDILKPSLRQQTGSFPQDCHTCGHEDYAPLPHHVELCPLHQCSSMQPQYTQPNTSQQNEQQFPTLT